MREISHESFVSEILVCKPKLSRIFSNGMRSLQISIFLHHKKTYEVETYNTQSFGILEYYS